jgi:hypothetical protein
MSSAHFLGFFGFSSDGSLGILPFGRPALIGWGVKGFNDAVSITDSIADVSNVS